MPFRRDKPVIHTALTYIFDIKIVKIKQNVTRLLFVILLLLFFCHKPISTLRIAKIDPVTNRPDNFTKIPYYNILCHPPEASQRKDWSEE